MPSYFFFFIKCNLKLSPKMFKVLQRIIKYIGHIILESGEEVDTEKVEIPRMYQMFDICPHKASNV